MSKFGLCVVDDTKTLEGTEQTWKRHVLFHNSEKICTSTNESNDLGLVAKGNKLLLNGETIAVSESETPPCINADCQFGEVDLLGHAKCINITKANYEALYSGKLVTGYKKYDSQAIYNIVPDVETASVVTCVKPSKGRDFLYNNINPEGLTHNVLTDATFTANKTPQLSVHDVSLRVEITDGVCDLVTLMYMVDTKDLQKLHFDKIDDTFTTIVKDSNGRELYKNTTFAGEFWIEFDLFKYGTPAEGETYFSIECIDNHGVGSVVQFIDVGVFNKEVPNYYDVEQHIDDDITATSIDDVITSLSFVYNSKTYTLYLNDNDKVHAYRNKLSLTALFAKAVDEGYNGVKLYNQNQDNPTKYYTTYQKDISGDADYDNPELGGQTYYVWTVANGTKTNEQEIIPGTSISVGGVSYEVAADESALDFIKRDGAHLHRVSSSISQTHAGKIWVQWCDDGRTWSDDRKTEENAFMRVYSSETELYAGEVRDSGIWENFSSYSSFALRTRKVSSSISNLNGRYYFVDNTEEFGDQIIFPNNFTVDLNGCIIQAVQCVGVSSGQILYLVKNYNTRIKNGKVFGIYKDVDFRGLLLAHGTTQVSVFEGLSNIRSHGSRYCVIEDVETRYSLGYNLQNAELKANWDLDDWISGGSKTGASFAFSNVGYLSLEDGTEVSAEPIREVVYHNDNVQYYEGLVYDSEYHEWGFKCGFGDIANNVDECIFYSIYTEPYSNGKEHELFFVFYSKSGNDYSYISTIKTRAFQIIKRPADATHYRIVAYGIIHNDGNDYVSTMHQQTESGNTYTINAAFYKFKLNCVSRTFSHGNLYKRINSFYTRTEGLTLETSGATFDECVFAGTACIPRLDWFMSKLLGGCEDGGDFATLLTIKNSKFIRLYSGDPEGYDLTDTVAFKIHYGKNVTIINNDGIGIVENPPVTDLYLANNNLKSLSVARGSTTANAHFIYIDNNVYDSYIDSLSYSSDVTSKHNGIRQNNCDEPISSLVTMCDMFTVESENKRASLEKTAVRYKNSVVDCNFVSNDFATVFEYNGYIKFNWDSYLCSPTVLDGGTVSNAIIVGKYSFTMTFYGYALDTQRYDAYKIGHGNGYYYISPTADSHDVFLKCDKVGISNAIIVMAVDYIRVPADINAWLNTNTSAFWFGFCGSDGVIEFLGDVPPKGMKVCYKSNGVITKATSLSDVSGHLLHINVPSGSKGRYVAALKSQLSDVNDTDISALVVEQPSVIL